MCQALRLAFLRKVTAPAFREFYSFPKEEEE